MLKQPIGFHLRLQDSITALAEQALALELDCFQFFLTASTRHNNYLRLTPDDVRAFKTLRSSFQNIYIHSSYWINPATCKPHSTATAKRLLMDEVRRALLLGIHHLVVHPGSANGHPPDFTSEQIRHTGIANVARMVNDITKKFSDIVIILENTAHGNRSIGSNLEDFKLIKEYLDRPEAVQFCFDTAHAFVYGYDFEDTNALITTIDRTMGLDNLALIHLNDSQEDNGSRKDRHASPGEGKIGKHLLSPLIKNQHLASIPLIIEAPSTTSEQKEETLKAIKSWN
jgi:deoxyribonuclease-4